MYFKDIYNDHGRLEIMEYYIEKNISWITDALKEWKGLHGIGACRSTVEENGYITSSISYTIFSDPEMTAENMNILRHMCLNMLKQKKNCRMGIKGKKKKCGW